MSDRVHGDGTVLGYVENRNAVEKQCARTGVQRVHDDSAVYTNTSFRRDPM